MLKAHEQARKNKRGKKEIVLFELKLAHNICEISHKLAQKAYKPKNYYSFKIYEPKERLIEALHYYDRVIQHALCDNILTPWLERRLIYDNVACRKEKGTHFGIARLTEHLRHYYSQHKTNKGWVLKADIRKYFANIDHTVLKQLLQREKIETDIKQLLYTIIDSHNSDTGKGIPIGNQTSQAFALYYLDKIDRYIKEQARIKYYVRYMDDMILIDNNKQKLEETLIGMKKIAEELKIEFNEKTQFIPLQNGIDFLGWHFYLTDTGKIVKKLRQIAKRRIFARLKKLQQDYKLGKAEINEIDNSITSIIAHLEHGNSYKLLQKMLDNFTLTHEKQTVTETK